MSNNGFILPSIPAQQMTPTVELLLAIIEQQQVTIHRLVSWFSLNWSFPVHV